jgi:hypothetical protein
MRARGSGDAIEGGLQHTHRTGDDPVASGMNHTGNNFLARERIKDHDRLAGMGCQPEAVIINSLDGQEQFFGAGF